MSLSWFPLVDCLRSQSRFRHLFRRMMFKSGVRPGCIYVVVWVLAAGLSALAAKVQWHCLGGGHWVIMMMACCAMMAKGTWYLFWPWCGALVA